MGTEELILDLEIMSNIYQSQIHNLKLARQHVIEDQRPVPDPNINTGDLVLVRDHTSKSFMPKYKTDYCVIRVLGNKVEIKDNNGKMSWFHISDVKKTDMITKLICQLPDYDAFGHKGRLSFDPERVKDLGWTLNDQNDIFDPSYISDAPATAAKQFSPNATEKCKSARGLIQQHEYWGLAAKQQCDTVVITVEYMYNNVYRHSVHKLCIICFTPLHPLI